MISTLPPHDFLKGTDFENSEYLNQLLAFVNANASTFGIDIKKQGVDKIPFIDGTVDPQTVTIDKPTWMGYSGSIWLAVPTGSGTKAYNISNLIQTGGVKKINNVDPVSSDGNFVLEGDGDIVISEDSANHKVIISSSGIDAKISANTTKADKALSDSASNKSAIDSNLQAINANTAKNNKHTQDIAGLDTRITKNTSDISTNATSIASQATTLGTHTSEINKNIVDIAFNKSAIIDNTTKLATERGRIDHLNSTVVNNIASSDDTIEVTRSGDSVDLKVKGGGGGGTVNSVFGKTPDADGKIKFKNSLSVTQDIGPDAHTVVLGVPLSTDAGNAMELRTNGWFTPTVGGGSDGVATINNVAPLNKNIAFEDPDGVIEYVKGANGVIDSTITLNPDPKNITKKTSTGLLTLESGTIPLDARADNLMKKSTAGDYYVSGNDLPVGDIKDGVFYDDTYTGGSEDGSFSKPYSSIGNAIPSAVDKTSTTGRLHTVYARGTASRIIGAGEAVMIGDSLGTKYAWLHLHFPEREFACHIDIDFRAKTEQDKNTVSLCCGDYSGSIHVTNPTVVADIGDQKEGINIKVKCDTKIARTDQDEFSIDFGNLDGIASKAYIDYFESVTSLRETANTGTTSSIVFKVPSTLRNFNFETNSDIQHIDTTQVPTGSPIVPVQYISLTPKASRDATVIVTIDILKKGRSLLYLFDLSEANFEFEISDNKVKAGILESNSLKTGTVEAGRTTLSQELVLDKVHSPVTEGGITYDKTSKSIDVMTADGIMKISSLSSDKESKKNLGSKVITVEDIIETNYEKRSIFIPKSYVVQHRDDADLPVKLMEMDAVDIGIRRKDITYGSDPTTQVVYARNDLLDMHDFTLNPIFSGMSYLKLSAISNVAIVDSADAEKQLETITMTVGDGSLTEDQLRDMIKPGFVYTLDSTAHGKTYSFIVYDIVSITVATGIVVLKVFSNIAPTTNIPKDLEKPFTALSEVQAIQTMFNELYFGDNVDFVFTKSFWKTKNRESMFPQYFPMFVQGKQEDTQQAVLLVPFNSRMLINKGKVGLKVGEKALRTQMIPAKFKEFFATKWGIDAKDVAMEIVGLPLLMGIVDDALDASRNECREIMPSVIKTRENKFEINYFAGVDPSVLSKMNQLKIFGTTKSQWTGLASGDIMADSENYIASFAQDCAYINELTMTAIPKAKGYDMAFAPVLRGNKLAYDDPKELQVRHFRDGFLGISEELNKPLSGQISYMLSQGNETVDMFCRKVSGSMLSPFEVRSVDTVRDVETPPVPSVKELYARTTNDQTASFNAVRFV